MTRIPFTLTACILALSATAAGAQMRAGQPAVLPSPPPAADPSIAVLAQFRGAYAAAGSPRLVIFWNRAFDDEVASEYEDRYTEHEVDAAETNGLEETTRGPAGDAVRSEGGSLRERRLETVAGTRRVRPAARAHAGTEAVDWQLEQAFVRSLQDGGAIVVDRTAALRLTGPAIEAGERPNVQALETVGMSGFADLMVEVLQTPDARAPGGVSYRVLVRDLRDARTVTTFLSAGVPPARARPYVAGPSGFVRAAVPTPGPSQIGAQLALETMASLSRSLQ